MRKQHAILSSVVGFLALATFPAVAGAADDSALRSMPLGSFVDATRLEQLGFLRRI